MKYTKHLLSLCFLINVLITFASPADPKPIVHKQPDGSTLLVYLKGDEHLSWAETQDGYTLLSNGSNAYMYAVKNEQNGLVPSSIIAHNMVNRNGAEKAFLSTITPKLAFSTEQKEIARNVNKSTTATTATFPSTGAHKMLIILVAFADVPFQSGGQVYFDSLANGRNFTQNGATGSIRQYYLDNSFGRLDLSATVVGPYTLSQNMAYYGANSGTYKDLHARDMIKEAVNLAAPDLDYRDFDNDGDGIVDNVYVVYSGYAEAQGGGDNTIWPHASQISGITKDGVSMGRYACSSELNGNSGTNKAGIGTICHEFGHVLGFPDFYDTDYETNGKAFDVGPWDLMASGSYNNDQKTPPYLTAYERNFLGWLDYTVLNSKTTNIVLPHLGKSNVSYRYNTTTTGDFFFVENRQKQGWDAYIPGHGMLIYHVDLNDQGWNNNAVNAKASHQAFDIIEADNIQSEDTRAGDPFPGTEGVTWFTDFTTPNSKMWNGNNTGKPITDIKEKNDTIFFNFMTDIMVNTTGVSNVKSQTATISAKLIDKPGFFTERGVCYGNTSLPDVSTDSYKVTAGTSLTFTTDLSNLNELTKYYARAYCKDTDGVYYYGEQVTFTTATYFTVNTVQPVNTDSIGFVIASGTVTTNEVGPAIIERGICFSQINNPDTSMGRIPSTSVGTTFSSKAEDLLGFANYYARAYIISSYGKVYYGASVPFTTLANEKYTITTNNATSIKAISSVVSGTIIPVKGTVTAYGVCYNTKTAPTIYQSKVAYTKDTNKENFSCTLPDLQPNTTYYARVYAKGGSGSYYYGNEIRFTTAQSDVFTVKTIEILTSKDNVEAVGIVKVTTGEIESRGFCYSSKHNPPTINDLVIVSATAIQKDTFTCELGKLSLDTVYYIRAYAIGKNGTVTYGNVSTHGTGINDVAYNIDYNVFPNPSTGVVNINLKGIENQVINISVKNTLGVEVMGLKNIQTGVNYDTALDISNLKQGIYYISITGEKIRLSKKIILTK